MKKIFAAIVTFCIFLLAASVGSAAPHEFTILHTSDLHAHLMPFEASDGQTFGGYARIKSYKDNLEKQGRNVIMLSSGDIFQGTFFYKFFQGIPDVVFMNRTGYSAMTLGNHEFDGGQAALAEAATYAKFPFLAANIQFKKTPELQNKIQPWVMLDAGSEADPVKIGVIGLTVENLHEIVPSVFVQDLDVVDAAATLKRYIPEVKKAGADVVLVLAHLGWDRELELFEQFPEVDGFLGGHTHLEISPPAVIKGPKGHRFISQPGEWGKGITRYDIVYDPDSTKKMVVTGAALVSMSEDLSEDTLIKQEADALWQKIQVKVNIPIGNTNVFLDGARSNIRTGETNLGNLVADCFTEAVEAEMALINGGGIRSSIATGTITIGDCLNVLPFDNYLIKVTLSGTTLIKIFEQVRAAIIDENGFGGFLQVSRGLEVKYYKNLVLVTFNGMPIDPNKNYTVATNDFLSGGGNGLTAFTEAWTAQSTGVLAADAFIQYVKAAKELSPQTEGRIIVNLTLPKHKMPSGVLKNIPKHR